MSEIDRDELRRLLAEATPRPWIAEVSGKTGPIVMDAQSASALDHVARCPHYRGLADSELIAAAINALPGLLDALEKAEGHRDSLAATLIEVQREKLILERATERGDILPDLLAQAWDEGFDAGERDAMDAAHTSGDSPCIPNPYRQSLSQAMTDHRAYMRGPRSELRERMPIPCPHQTGLKEGES